jgi:hypothetical protein
MSESPRATEPALTAKQQQAIAHRRGRICKVRNCTVCAPLRESRRLKKAQRKADAQARAHSRGEPCGRNSCSVPGCVAARHAAPETSAAAVHRVDDLTGDPGAARRRQAERHRAGLPCGFETCAVAACVDGFAQERARRHRARRPCTSTECTNPICVAARPTPFV